MSRLITEREAVQKPFIKYAQHIGWQYITVEKASAFRAGTQGKFFYDILAQNLVRLNPFINEDDARGIIRNIENIPDTMEGNKQVLDWLQGRRSFYDQQERRERPIFPIDFENPENNEFYITQEWAHASISHKNRSDIIFLVNGIPLAIVENKNPKNKDPMQEAITQLARYEEQTPEMLCCPQVFNIADVCEYFYGATWNYSRKNIFNWKKELKHKREKNITWEEAVKSFFDKANFLRLVRQCVLFFYKDDELKKTVLQQHQIRAIDKIDKRCTKEKNKTRGLIWHTQGSGKTFTMITAARIILERKPNATVMMIIDRQELEGQLSGWIDRLIESHQEIVVRKAESKIELQEILKANAGGLIISMIHKFDQIKNNSCTRQDFYVLIDEAHRSVNKDLGNYLTAALPNATLFGFTGTPVDKTASGKGTFKIFGKYDKEGYLDKYSIRESIEDGTTLQLRYENVPNQLKLSDELLEEEFLQQAESEGVSDIDDLNEVLRKAVRLKTFLKADDRIDKVAAFIADHFKEKVQPLGYKAFVVAVDREACALYKEALDKLLPGMSQAIYSKGHNDRGILDKYQKSEAEEKQTREFFKKADSEPHILIVTDKLLTGYDAPILYCMYLDKPMRDHVLLQAIARVNRPYENSTGIRKPCGLIVDFVGIFKSMSKALAFDANEVNAVIEDIDRLFDRFKNLIDEELGYLPMILATQDDKLVEKLLYEDFKDSKIRDEFVAKAKELEDAYEVLSPDKRLQPYMSKYQNIIEIQRLLIRAYSGDPDAKETKFLDELGRKTERFIRENLQAHTYKVDQVFEINAETLTKLKKDKTTSEIIKVMNLLKSIIKMANEEQNENPALISIDERANEILKEFKDGQEKSREILRKAYELSNEAIESQKAQKELGLDKETFLIYWCLKKANLENPKQLAIEINTSFEKFENFNDNTDEKRQLKLEIYARLVPLMEQDNMLDVTDKILKLMEKVYGSR
ncbi:MAG: HsdR family type I site-specific deoxyribonuclease [Chromatiales bacterium]|nr:HsdR family type I site-specific deoxyribonuclease [Chromatiales bacterium]